VLAAQIGGRLPVGHVLSQYREDLPFRGTLNASSSAPSAKAGLQFLLEENLSGRSPPTGALGALTAAGLWMAKLSVITTSEQTALTGDQLEGRNRFPEGLGHQTVAVIKLLDVQSLQRRLKRLVIKHKNSRIVRNDLI
jgi:hypothetical protein